MTPDNIVKAAISEGLHVIALTDHNDISNVQATIKAADSKGILAIPGVELSTPQGHLLCYLPRFEALQTFFAKIKVVDHGKANSRCQNAMLESLTLLESLGGFGVMAHVDGTGGFEKENPGNSPHKVDVLCHKALLGIEVVDAQSPVTYSDGDSDADRAHVGGERIKRLSLGAKQFLARALNSDAHTLGRVGKNAKGLAKITRVKMNKPSFDALRIAFEDSDARVRMEDTIPTAIPYVVGVRMEGGFLDGQEIHFSQNLNCIIGGRGTGKSTTFEVVRMLTGEQSTNSVLDSDAWPNELTIVWKDQAGQEHILSRAIGNALRNIQDPLQGPTSFQIESYGQGETAEISKHANDNPLALLEYLDRFIDVKELILHEDQARDELLEVQTAIEAAMKDVAAIPQHEKALTSCQRQLQALKQAKAVEIIELQQKLEEEREVRSQVVGKIAEIEEALNAFSSSETIQELIGLADPEKLAVGAAEFKKILKSAAEFQTTTDNVTQGAQTGFDKLRNEVEVSVAEWKAKETQILDTIEQKRKLLEAQNIRLDMAYIQKLAKSEAKTKADLVTLRKAKPLLISLKSQSTKASVSRWGIRDRIAMTRNAFAKYASETLGSILTDLTVSLKFSPSTYAPDAEQHIIQVMEWRTSQVPRAAVLIERLSLPGLLKAIDSNAIDSIVGITANNGEKVFSRAEAQDIVERLSEPSVRFALERCEVHDLPRLIVTKVIQGGAGASRKHVNKEFSRLSLGQQQSVLLALMLLSKNNSPLIIDQPEDNLDGEFIYHSLVPVLRLAKERRQIIIVTHNANITVLGDAELIVVLKSTSDKGVIVSRGSIDDKPTRDAACDILEGAREAFRRRASIYGII